MQGTIGTVGALGPIQPFEFFTPPPTGPILPLVEDDSDGWWGGVYNCAVTVALAAVVAIGALTANAVAVVNAPQDDTPSISSTTSGDGSSASFGGSQPSLNLRYVATDSDFVAPVAFQPDEDFWQNPVQPVPATLGRIYLPDAEEIPAGSLVNLAVDELYWQNPVAPVSASMWQPLPLAVDPDFTPFQPDEDFWQNPVAPVPSSLGRIYLQDPEELPAGSLVNLTVDELFWQNPTAPIASALWQALPYSFDAGEGFPPLTFAPDEDFWVNGVAPVQPRLWQFLPLGVDSDSSPFQPDEDFWQNPVAPVVASQYQRLPLGDPEELPAGSLFGQPEEDLWQNTVPAVPATLGRLYLPDPEEIPAGSLARFSSPDEDFWANPAAPVAASLFQDLPLAIDPDFVSPLTYQLDEDFWLVSLLPAPVQASLYERLPLGDPEEIPALAKFSSPDEDFWQNQVQPIAASLGALYLPDPEQSLPHGPTDEDFWANPAAPVAASLCYPAPWVDADFVQPPVLGLPDEDFWRNPVAATPATLGRLYLPDPESVSGNLIKFSSPDEDLWVPPQPWPNVQSLVGETAAWLDEVIASVPLPPRVALAFLLGLPETMLLDVISNGAIYTPVIRQSAADITYTRMQGSNPSAKYVGRVVRARDLYESYLFDEIAQRVSVDPQFAFFWNNATLVAI